MFLVAFARYLFLAILDAQIPEPPRASSGVFLLVNIGAFRSRIESGLGPYYSIYIYIYIPHNPF